MLNRDEPLSNGPSGTSIHHHPVSTVRIDSLVLDDSPRLSGEDPEHTRLLAETDDDLPPITVHLPTMRVIDGMHRVRAALLKGRCAIEARLLDCDEESAFVLAVKANVTHGLPLTHTDRKAAAARIIASRPHWSDRAVAATIGLSDKTVCRIRTSSTAEIPQLNARRGRDGRRRTLNTGAGRLRAAAMIEANPKVALREVARATGLSPATVRDVRQRIDRRDDPVPQRFRSAENRDSSAASRQARQPAGRTRQLDTRVDPHAILAKLRNDPCLRFNEVGRRTLRWLHQHLMDIESWEREDLNVPNHCAPAVAALARSYAVAWTMLAEQLEGRADDGRVKRS